MSSCSEKSIILEHKKYEATMIVLGLDLSNSFQQKPVSVYELRSWLEGMTYSNVVSIHLFCVGKERQNAAISLRLSAEMQPQGTINSLKVRSKLANKTRKIRNLNEEAIDKFVNHYQRLTEADPLAKWTDLKSFNNWLNILLNEPHYSEYNKTVFVYSDGVHSIPKKKEAHFLNLKNRNCEVYTSGFIEPDKHFNGNHTELTSPNSFFTLIK